MSDWVKFLVYTEGNIVLSEEGACYDCGPKTLIKVDVGTQYVQLEENIADELEIDLVRCKMEISHRYPMTENGRTKYVLISIKNDKDVFLLIDFAVDMGKGQVSQIFVSTYHLVEQDSIPSVNTPSVAVHRPLIMQPMNTIVQSAGQQCSRGDSNSVLISLFTSDCNVVTDNREMEVPLTYYQHSGWNGYITFEEEFRSSGNQWSFSDELKKSMRWDSKEQLIHAVKIHHILNHHDFKVVRSNNTLWCVKCVNQDTGCMWRLRACKKKGR